MNCLWKFFQMNCLCQGVTTDSAETLLDVSLS